MSAARKTILVVDDDLDMREALTEVLTDEGYQVAEAGDGLEALAYLRTHPPPGLILLDWMMPRCDGLQFRAEQLRDPGLATIPVVLLTADGRVGEKSAALSVEAHLAKPIELQRLLDTILRSCS